MTNPKHDKAEVEPHKVTPKSRARRAGGMSAKQARKDSTKILSAYWLDRQVHLPACICYTCEFARKIVTNHV